MKSKQLLFVAIALIVAATSCRRSTTTYLVETCSSSAAVERYVDSRQLPSMNPKNGYNKNWQVVAYNKDEDWVKIRYIGDRFEDLCVSEITGMKVNIKGAFLDAEAYVKPIDNDSFKINLSPKQVVDSGQLIIAEWHGSYDSLNLKSYYALYPGKMTPVIYVKMSYTWYMDDTEWAYYELAKDFRDFRITPIGKKF